MALEIDQRKDFRRCLIRHWIWRRILSDLCSERHPFLAGVRCIRGPVSGQSSEHHTRNPSPRHSSFWILVSSFPHPHFAPALPPIPGGAKKRQYLLKRTHSVIRALI